MSREGTVGSGTTRAVEIGGNRDADGSQGNVVGRGPTRGYDSVLETRVVDPKLREDLLRVGRRLYRSRCRNNNWLK